MQKANRVIFRTDGNNTIGFGHVIRCSSLAEVLNGTYTCILATRFYGTFVKSLVERSFADVWQLDPSASFDTFIHSLNPGDIVVLDSYDFTEEHQQQLLNFGCHVVCIDDLYKGHFVADLIINHALNATEEKYSSAPSTRFALGPAFALLRPPFFQNSKPKVERIQTIFLALGKASPIAFTSQSIAALRHYQLHVIPPANYSAEPLEGVSYYESLDATELAQLLASCDLAIVPASGICLEAACVNVPIISGYYVDNQISNYQGLIERGLIKGIGNLNEFDFSYLADVIGELPVQEAQHMQERQRATFDGNRDQRILNLFNEISKK